MLATATLAALLSSPLLALAAPPSAGPQDLPLTDTLLVDLDPSVENGIVGSIPRWMGSNNERSFFTAFTTQLGTELWVTDGTAGGTSLVLDLYPGTSSGVQSTSRGACLDDGRLVFYGLTPGLGREPFVTDGTPGGTQLLRDVFPGPPGSNSSANPRMVAFGGRVLFSAQDPESGREIWSTDGSPEGTRLEIDLRPGPLSGAATSSLFPASSHVIVAGSTGTGPQQGSDLYRWDGPGSEAVLLDQFGQYVQDDPSTFCTLGDRTVFNVDGRQWWITDGTPAGTLKLFHSPTAIEGTGWCQASGDRLYLTGKVATGTPQRLLVGSGAPGDLEQVQDWAPSAVQAGSATQNVLRGLPIPGGLLLAAEVPGIGVEPVVCLGSSANSYVLDDLRPGAAGSSPELFFELDGVPHFIAAGPGTGRELWRADLSVPGAVLAGPELVPGPGGLEVPWPSAPALPTANGVVFGAEGPTTGPSAIGTEPVVATAAGLQLLANLAPDSQPADARPGEFTRLGHRAVFRATTVETGTEPWVSDGTLAGTQPLGDLWAGEGSSSSSYFSRIGDRVLFSAYFPEAGQELWSTDGTPAGTFQVDDFDPGPSNFSPRGMTLLGEQVLFCGRTAETGAELFRLAPDGETIELVADIRPGEQSSSISYNDVAATPELRFPVFQGRVVFRADDLAHGRELWASDGTPAGTELLFDLNPGSADSDPGPIAVLEDRIVFAAETEEFGRELWVSDGTAEGTEPLADLYSGGGSSNPLHLQHVAGGVVFTAENPEFGRELYRSDGTPEGTELVVELVPGAEGGWSIFGLSPQAVGSGGRAYLERVPEAGPGELWVTDGTAAGTLRLGAGEPGEALLEPLEVWPAGEPGRVMFRARSAAGEELWTTDGTAEGTFAITDSAPGQLSSSPGLGVQLGTVLLFPAGTPAEGLELHSVPLLATGGFGAASLGSGCGSGASAPTLSVLGQVEAPGDFALRVVNAGPLNTVLFYFSTGFTGPNPLGTCEVLLTSATPLGSSAAGPEGAALLPVGLPNSPALVGLPIFVQAAPIEVGGPFLGLASLTHTLELIPR